MLKKPKKLLDEAEDNYSYKRYRKRYLSKKEGLCSFCRPHRGENASRKERNWKSKSKKRKQYLK